jgi:acetyl-CoA carboxylase biotin carboxylase subunit
VGLHNAATAEFLFDADRRFWFLEVNARLQVEHGVTELVTDLDLVAEQLWIAAGAPLSDAVRAAAATATSPGRHAIEVRLSAEDPARGFAPTPGRIGRWSMPSGPGVRVDTAIRPGESVPPDYDPMIAKVMTVGPDRRRAIRRMRRALDEVVVTGVQTTLPFHRALMRDGSFEAGDALSTDHVDEAWDGAAERAAALTVGQRLATAAAQETLVGPAGAGQVEMSLHKDAVAGTTGWRRAGRRAAIDRWPR